MSLVFENFNSHVVTCLCLPWKTSHGCFGKRWEVGGESFGVAHSPSVLRTGNSFEKPRFPNMESWKGFHWKPHPVCVFFISNPTTGIIKFIFFRKTWTNLKYFNFKSSGSRFILIFKLVTFFLPFILHLNIIPNPFNSFRLFWNMSGIP